jgi:hypothetical protein
MFINSMWCPAPAKRVSLTRGGFPHVQGAGMKTRWLLVSLAAGVMFGCPQQASAQSEPYRQAQAGPNQKQTPRGPRLDPEDQLRPGQFDSPQEPDRGPAPARSSKKAAPKRPAEPTRVVACSGTFAKDSDHSKLAAAFRPENVELAAVDAGTGKKAVGSVLFPKDPKRRLEVWWRDEANHSGTYLIVIGGQSTWTGPKGVRLGLGLAALEKLNTKPFTLMGFGKDGVAPVTDWQSGALGELPGDCVMRVSFRPDPKTPAAARNAISSDKEFASSDAVVRAVKPSVSEILIGY